MGEDVLVVGAEGEDSAAAGVDGDETDNSEEHRGAAYIFRRTSDVWTQVRYLKPTTAPQLVQTSFAKTVAVDGATVLVGASTESLYIY